MTWFVYLIECTDGSIYTGITTSVWRRYAEHASGRGARYTRSHPPEKLLAVLCAANRSAASQLEYRIKQLTAHAKRELALQLTGPWHAAH
ncbi:GIY-YIG nuclease family protein [Chitinilyticum piscinae]|uniref:GIY-YIG nuclease family protein n=1 Tax=Chitinilyticum piscinae TaxID=2866724 RepID=A0A8J7K198_9NEIS|nr:GIY-YIG nuclease family protein [Chitinilyticum piscinae]MBE9608362.1 GIY-YIG nuclease family protein [Chitinilyticum piscinae]